MSLGIVSTITSGDEPGARPADFRHLVKTSALNVILGSTNFGTGSYYPGFLSVSQMLDMILAEAKPFVVVQMGAHYSSGQVDSFLCKTGVFTRWGPGDAMPDLLPFRLLDLLLEHGAKVPELQVAESVEGAQVRTDEADNELSRADLVHSGKRLVKFSDGDVYHGEFTGERPHGYGIHRWMHAASDVPPERLRQRRYKRVYVGNWKEGRESGYGEMWYTNGEHFAGEWENGRPSGRGVMRSERTVSAGSFKNGKRNGWCTTFYTEPHRHVRKYVGDYVNDKKDGYGEAYSECGSWYKGYWHKGNRHGNGQVYVTSENRIIETVYHNGRNFEDLPPCHLED